MRRLAWVVLVWGCNNDLGLRAIPNEPPKVEIVSHANGDVAREGYAELLVATVDDDRDLADLTVRWFANEEEVCAGPPDEDGSSRCEVVAPLVDAWRIRVEARDEPGEFETDSVELGVDPTEAPVVRILDPDPTDRFYSNVPIPLVAEVTDAEDGPEGLSVDWSSNQDGSVAAGIVPDALSVATTSGLLSEGRHELTVLAVDSTGKTDQASIGITVGPANSAPECSILVPLDGSITTYDADLLFSGTATDVDQPSDELLVSWSSSVDGLLAEDFPNPDGSVRSRVRLTRGIHDITLVVTDEVGFTCEQKVTVDASNTAPTPPSVEITPQEPTALDDLLCSVIAPSTDAEGDPIEYHVTWTRDGALFEEALTTTLPGDTVSWEATAPGQVWACEVRGFDGLAEGDPGRDEVRIEAPAVTVIHASTDHGCHLDTATVLTCWGSNEFGVLTLIGGRYAGFDVGPNHTCAISPDGATLQCVGWASDGATDVSGLVGPFAQVTLGEQYGCVIDGRQEIQCWGKNSDGQTDTSGLTAQYVQISAGTRHACAVETDNDVACWGSDVYGRSTPPPGVKMQKVSAGTYHTCGIDLSGNLHCWGRNNFGQLFGPPGSYLDVAAGEAHTCGVLSTGALACWGELTGPGEINAAPAGTQWVGVDVGTLLSCAYDADGVAECWGDNTFGETENPAVWW